MKIKTAELDGAALNWAVAVCHYSTNDLQVMSGNIWYGRSTSGFICYRPSDKWEHGGPIIDREEITIDYRDNETRASIWDGEDFIDARAGKRQGLIAAMRCYVTAKLGDVVEIPDQLL